jgi:tetratricopeptide (TPR) repeat protein
MNPNCLYFFLFFFISPLVFAVNDSAKIKALKASLAEHPQNDKKRVDLLNDIGYEYWIISPLMSIEFGEKALQSSKELKYDKGLALANRVIGVAYWARGEENNALNYLLQSQKFYEQLNDIEGIANLLLNIGMVYADLEQYNLAIEKYSRAIELFSAIDKEGRIATTNTKMATILITQKKTARAEKLLAKSLEIHSKNNFTYGIAEVHNRLAVLYLSEDKVEMAFDQVTKSMKKSETINDIDGLTSNLIILGKIRRLKNQWAAAEACFQKALELAQTNQLKKYKLQAYEELIVLKKLQKQAVQALYYAEKYMVLKDELFNLNKSKQIAYLEFENKLAHKEKELSQLKTSQIMNNVIKVALSVGMLLLALVGVFLYQLNRKNKQLLRTKNLMEQQEIENGRLKERELTLEIETKNKELASYALTLVQKNEILKEVQKKVHLIKENGATKDTAIFKDINSSIQVNLSGDKDWDDFRLVFEQVHTDFYAKLIDLHPDLKSNDLKICSLTRLNLNIKETASILGISPASVKTARYRLRKKMQLDPNQEIISYLIDIEKNLI